MDDIVIENLWILMGLYCVPPKRVPTTNQEATQLLEGAFHDGLLTGDEFMACYNAAKSMDWTPAPVPPLLY